MVYEEWEVAGLLCLKEVSYNSVVVFKNNIICINRGNPDWVC